MKVRALNSSGASEGGLKSSFIRSLATAKPVSPPVTVLNISQHKLCNMWASVSVGCAIYTQEASVPVDEMLSHCRANLTVVTMNEGQLCMQRQVLSLNASTAMLL